MFRDTVTLEDAVTVVSVMESSMQGGALLGGINALHTSFPENPMAQYRTQCELILERLGLQDLLQKELQRLDSNTDAEETFQKKFPVPKISPNKLASKTLCKTSCSEERSASIPRKGNGMRESLTTLNLHASLEQDKVSKISRKRPEEDNCFSSEANIQDPASPSASVQDSVITQRVSKSWQRLHTKKSRGFFTSTQDPQAKALPSVLPASGLSDLSSDADSVLGEEKESVSVAAKAAAISMRKQSKGQVEKETKVVSSHEPEILDSESPPAAKLAKFSFRPRTKLGHSSEKKNEECSLFQNETIFKPGEQLQGEQLPEECCPPEKCKMTLTRLGKNSLEKRSVDNKGTEEQQSQALGKEIRGKEKLGGPSTGKVRSTTLAKLSTFSFASHPESKLETIKIDTNKESHSPLLKVHVSNPSRRKSFALGNASKASVVTQKSLFSIAELDDASLDFDWDEEVRKNPST
uniref:Uncharacterized protein n=1 Tax=Accipiter nisus TaxID=211598 RepID=A0A8B9MBP4_9AVES